MNEWQPMNTAAHDDTAILLLLGETIPGQADARVGSYAQGSVCEELGYGEFGNLGGWLFWTDERDFFIEDIAAPKGWFPLPVGLQALPADLESWIHAAGRALEGFRGRKKARLSKPLTKNKRSKLARAADRGLELSRRGPSREVKT